MTWLKPLDVAAARVLLREYEEHCERGYEFSGDLIADLAVSLEHALDELERRVAS